MINRCSKENDDIEIDLFNLMIELKNQWIKILGVTLLFAIVSLVYSSYILKPVFQGSIIVRIPSNSINHEYTINTCVETLKLKGISNVTRIRGTSLLKIDFIEASANIVKTNMDKLLPFIEKETNAIIKDARSTVSYTSADFDTKVELIRQKDIIKNPTMNKIIRNMLVSATIGFILSCFYITIKYVKESKNKLDYL